MKPLDAARRLGMSTKELYRLVDEGRLPAYRFGRRTVRLLAEDVEEYARAHPPAGD